jgi:hypothetical protein
MGLISFFRARLRSKRNQSTRIQACVRAQVSHSFAIGQKVRFYTNAIGESFAVERKATIPSEGKEVFNQTAWSVTVTPIKGATSGLTGRIIGSRLQKCLHIVEANRTNEKSESGRELFRAMIDECKQIGMDVFPKTNYSIYVKPASKKLSKYYQDLGFKPVHTWMMLEMKVKR